MTSPKKVVVAMSGGVDSSVAAALLKEQGYDVYGVTMRLSNWESRQGRTFGGCCGSKDFYDARAVAQTLGIPHYSFDYVDKFRGSVIDYFKASYLKGETPNPCIACNQHVKFDALLEKAMALGADYLATGHYARIDGGKPAGAEKAYVPEAFTAEAFGPNGVRPKRRSIPNAGSVDAAAAIASAVNAVEANASEPNAVGTNAVATERRSSHLYLLKKAVDLSKDQSYVLYGLGQAQLSRLLFPLGELTKVQVRQVAKQLNLRTADKPDSYEICFVPNEDYRQFITEEVAEEARPSGPIRHVDGRILGQHKGLPYYTIGQREGLGLAVGRPLYVTAIETQTNTLVVGDKDDVLSHSMTVRQVSWVSGVAPSFPCEASVKIRSKHIEAAASLTLSELKDVIPACRKPGSSVVSTPVNPSSVIEGNAFVHVQFAEPQSAVTPGQAAVFYNGDTVLGGGFIDHAA